MSGTAVLVFQLNMFLSVNGGWGAWDKWSECSATCGEGEQTRSHQCDYPHALRGGKPCEGDNRETKSCLHATCKGGECLIEFIIEVSKAI